MCGSVFREILLLHLASFYLIFFFPEDFFWLALPLATPHLSPLHCRFLAVVQSYNQVLSLSLSDSLWYECVAVVCQTSQLALAVISHLCILAHRTAGRL